MYIGHLNLNQLRAYKNETNPVVSLYLNVTPPRDYMAHLNSLLHNTRRRVADHYDKKQLQGLDGVLEKIEKHVREKVGRPRRTRLVAIFADADGLWEEYHLPVAMSSQVVVGSDIYIRPLTVISDEFERYCVLVCDTRKARIFSLYLGEFTESPDVFLEDNVPDRVRTAARAHIRAGAGIEGGLGDENIRSHIEDHIHRHLKHVAQKTFRFFQEKSLNRLILAGPDEKILRQLQDHLHSYLHRHIAGKFRSSPDEQDEQLRQKALEVSRQYERKQEKALIEKLFEKSGPAGMSVLGVDPVLEALRKGQVHTLVLDHDFQEKGYLCPRDNILSTHLTTCPVCEKPMEETEDLAEEMVESALAQGAEIEHVFADHADFKNYRVGAILRFTLNPIT